MAAAPPNVLPAEVPAPGWPYAAARSLAPVAIGLLIAYLIHRFVGPGVGPFFTKVLLDIGIGIILAVSLNIVNGYTGQFSLGHAGFMAVGAYTAGLITYYGSHLMWGSATIRGGFLGPGELLFVAACLAGGLVAALFGLLVGLPTLRLRGDYLAIVTLGFNEILRVILQRTDDVLFLPDEIRAVAVPRLVTHVGGALGFGGLAFYTNLFYVYAFVAITLIVATRLKLGSYGRAFLAIREDEAAAESMGIPVFSYKVRAFVIAAFFAGVAGGLFGHLVGNVLTPTQFSFMRSIDIVIMVVLGGMGSITGSMLAAIILAALPEALRTFAQWRMILYALALILMMILRPKGLFGTRELWDLPRLWKARRIRRKGGEDPKR